jgi:hypothetical protein
MCTAGFLEDFTSWPEKEKNASCTIYVIMNITDVVNYYFVLINL